MFMHLDSVRDNVGSGPGIVLWRYREHGGAPALSAENPFAEFAHTMPETLYRRCFNVVAPPECRFPVPQFLKALPKFRIVILHNPEVFVDMPEVLPELAKACMGHNTRLVLISEWGDFLRKCQRSLEPLAELLPISSIAPAGA